ncbi:hypothetical protein [Diadegma fenestrale ichnovirus]|nr:hypothetical protein [Diadegma fenestrale ichnovirus]
MAGKHVRLCAALSISHNEMQSLEFPAKNPVFLNRLSRVIPSPVHQPIAIKHCAECNHPEISSTLRVLLTVAISAQLVYATIILMKRDAERNSCCSTSKDCGPKIAPNNGRLSDKIKLPCLDKLVPGLVT